MPKASSTSRGLYARCCAGLLVLAAAQPCAAQARAQLEPRPQSSPAPALPDAPPLRALPDSRPSARPIPRPPRTVEQQLALDAWRESIELGLPLGVIAAGLPLVGADGALARDAEAAALVARALAQTGRGPEADALLATGSFPEPERGWTEIERARRALDAGDFERVHAILSSASGPDGSSIALRHANYAESWLLVARAYARSGEHARAGKLAQRFVELDPLHPDAAIGWHLLATAARARGDAPTAQRCEAAAEEARTWRAYLDARRRQIREQPDEPLPRYGLATCWMQAGEHDKARAVLEDLAARAPRYCRVWFMLGEARRRNGDAAGANAAWTSALECDPSDAKSRYNRGQLALLERRFEAAEADLSALVGTPAEREPQYARLQLLLARCALARKDTAAAERAYQKYTSSGGTEPLGE